MEWDGKERRKSHRLSDDEINRIFDIGEKRVEQYVGKGSIRFVLRALWVGCALFIGWMAAKAGLK